MSEVQGRRRALFGSLEDDEADGDAGWRCCGTTTAADWGSTDRDLEAAEEWLEDWRVAVAEPRGAATGPVVQAVRDALADDLDAPAAAAAIRRWSVATNEGADRSEEGAGGVIRTLVDARLGLLL